MSLALAPPRPPRPPEPIAPIGPAPAAELIPASVAAMNRSDWATAAAGFLRVREELGAKTPRPVYARAATCLHHLGQFAAAEKLAFEGLGPERALITPPSSPPPEEVILRHWTQPTAPVISIVCPTYNHERYIESAIRGFLSQQTAFPFEILIHDDASTDGTAALVRAWQKKYPSIIRSILQTENQYSRGVRPIDLLLKESRGRYVATCEGDDYWLQPSKLQRQVGFLEQHPDFSCSAHNYYLYNEAQLAVRPWLHSGADRILSERQLMNITRLLWVPTLVFRKTFSAFPPERAGAPVTDQFLTSYLGTFGRGAYFETFLGAVRRENQHSIWTPMSDARKEVIRVKTWLALTRLHDRLGNAQAATDLRQRVAASSLNATEKSALIAQYRGPSVPALPPEKVTP